jgi:hypothetical protein
MIKPRSVMMYGISGSTKTSQLYHLVKWLIKQNPGKKFRMVHSDGGGWAPFEDSGMIERGEVEVFDLSASKNPFNDYRRLSDGYWPRPIKGGGMFFQKVEQCLTTPQEWENILGYVVEGLASTGEAIKAYISNQKEGAGFKESWSIITEDGDTILGLQQGHYGIVQRELYERHMLSFNCLPIKWLLYSSLLGKGEDKNNRETVFGPQVCGNASTPSVPTWFMDCLHLNKEKYVIGKKDELGNVTEIETEGMVAWFARHNDTVTGVPCLCKPRVMPELYPGLLKYFPRGFVPLSYDRGITDYFRVLESLKQGIPQ